MVFNLIFFPHMMIYNYLYYETSKVYDRGNLLTYNKKEVHAIS